MAEYPKTSFYEEFISLRHRYNDAFALADSALETFPPNHEIDGEKFARFKEQHQIVAETGLEIVRLLQKQPWSLKA